MRYAVIALCAAAGPFLLLLTPFSQHTFVYLGLSAVIGFKNRRWSDGMIVSLIAAALFMLLRYWRGADLEAMLTLLLTAPIFITVAGLGGYGGSRLSSWLNQGEKPAWSRAAAVCAVGCALTMHFVPLKTPMNCLQLCCWAAAAGFQERRWTGGLWVPFIGALLLWLYKLYMGWHPFTALEASLFTSPAYLAIGGLGGWAGAWLSRRRKPGAEGAPLSCS